MSIGVLEIEDGTFSDGQIHQFIQNFTVGAETDEGDTYKLLCDFYEEQKKAKAKGLRNTTEWILKRLAVYSEDFKNRYEILVNQDDDEHAKKLRRRKKKQEKARKKAMQTMEAQREKFSANFKDDLANELKSEMKSEAESVFDLSKEDFHKNGLSVNLPHFFSEHCCIICRSDEDFGEIGMLSRAFIDNPLSCYIDPSSRYPNDDLAAGSGLIVKCCGHAMHFGCFSSYFAELQNKSHTMAYYEGSNSVILSKGEMLCPFCKGLVNCLVPVYGPLNEEGNNVSPGRRDMLSAFDSVVLEKHTYLNLLQNTMFHYEVFSRIEMAEGVVNQVSRKDLQMLRLLFRTVMGRLGESSEAIDKLQPECETETLLMSSLKLAMQDDLSSDVFCQFVRWGYESDRSIQFLRFASILRSILGVGEYHSLPSGDEDLASHFGFELHESSLEIPRLIDLPSSYEAVFESSFRSSCIECGENSRSMALCLVCGNIMCFRNSCQGKKKGHLSSHSLLCGSGIGDEIGVFLNIRRSTICLIRSGIACEYPSPYLDEYGEDDPGLIRGRFLTLDNARWGKLTRMWVKQEVIDEISRTRLYQRKSIRRYEW